MLTEHGVGWEAFRDVAFIGQMTLVMLIALLLSVVIAYHPVSRRKASRLEEFEHPKTFIMYSIVGAVIALIVKVQPSMALVIFGIGGLLRFRTNVGEAKNTGRVILVTVIGLCCGLELYVVAFLATVFGWLLIYAMEGQSVSRLMVMGLKRDQISRAAQSHAKILQQAGCTILGQQLHVLKGYVSIVYRAPDEFDMTDIEIQIGQLSEDERGAVDWEVG